MKVGARICIEGVITHMDAEHVLVRLETGGELAIPRGWFHSPIYKASFACPTLTDLQKETLDIICGYRRIHGMAPTVRELCRIMSIRSTCTMQRRIQVLRRKGYLAASNNRSRSLRPVEFLGDESEQPLGVTRQ